MFTISPFFTSIIASALSFSMVMLQEERVNRVNAFETPKLRMVGMWIFGLAGVCVFFFSICFFVLRRNNKKLIRFH